jgi:hypothetical protein
VGGGRRGYRESFEGDGGEVAPEEGVVSNRKELDHCTPSRDKENDKKS